MADQSPDEPLETFYGDDADEVGRLDEAAAPGDDRHGAAPAKPGARRTTVTGALMAGIAMGLREAFEPTYHDRTAVEQPAPEQPLEPQKYEVHLDPVVPESSFAIYRPWVDGDDDDPHDPDHPGPAKSDVPHRKGGGAGALGG